MNQETGRKAYLSIASYQDIYALLFTIISHKILTYKLGSPK